MKTLKIETERRPLAELLAGKNGKEVIYLTMRGRTRYAVVPLDEGDEEALAIRRNKKLMAYLDKCAEESRKGPRKSIDDVEKKLGIRPRKKSRS